MKKTLTTFLISTMIATQTGQLEAQSPPKPGEGVAPAAVGQTCTGASALRGSTVAVPKSGDVATISQLCAGGVSVASLNDAPSILPPATTVSNTALTRDQSLPPLVALGAPSSSSVDIRTVNGNWTHLFSGAFWHAPAIGPKGELQAIDTGHAQFSVAAALGYFAVVMPHFLARVKGTIFDVDYEPGQSVTFKVSEGSVLLIRITAIYLEAENRTIQGIRQTDTISANGQSSIQYKDPQPPRTFKNSQQAQQTLQQELQEATAEGDPQTVENAINNIQLVTGKPVALASSQVAHAANSAGSTSSGAGAGAGAGAGSVASSLLPAIVFAAAATTVGIVTTSNNKTSAPAAPQSTPTGTITLSSIPRATPLPTPLPTPTPSPRPTAPPIPNLTKPGLPAGPPTKPH